MITYMEKNLKKKMDRSITKSLSYIPKTNCVDHNKLWEILQEMGISDRITTCWEICVQVKKQQLEPDVEQWTGSKLRK